jgi:hypothetical protein
VLLRIYLTEYLKWYQPGGPIALWMPVNAAADCEDHLLIDHPFKPLI